MNPHPSDAAPAGPGAGGLPGPDADATRSDPALPALPPPEAAGGAPVFDIHYARILKALAGRARYRYVQPRLLRQGAGWRIVSPNCSRNIDRDGGEIPIAWLEPLAPGPQALADGDEQTRWQLHAYHHTQGRWVPRAGPLTLADALTRLCLDPNREFWP